MSIKFRKLKCEFITSILFILNTQDKKIEIIYDLLSKSNIILHIMKYILINKSLGDT